jgi:hypothetical protein
MKRTPSQNVYCEIAMNNSIRPLSLEFAGKAGSKNKFIFKCEK